MKKIIPLFKGIMLMCLVAGILLMIDASNRHHNKKGPRTSYTYDTAVFNPLDYHTAAFKNRVREGLRKDWPKEIMRLALIEYSDSPFTEFTEEGIREALTEIGLSERADYLLEVFNAQGDITMLNSIIDLIASKPYDFVLTTSTPTLQAACRKLSNKTIVFTTVADPIAAGAGKTFTDHLPNLTGISTLSDFTGMADIVEALIPGIQRIGTLFCPAEVNSVVNKESFETIVTGRGIELVAVPINSSSEIGNATLSMIAQDIQAICQVIDNITGAAYPQIIRLANDHSIPYFTFDSWQISQGATAAVARDYHQAGKDAVYLLGRLIAGEHPKNIPFQYVSKTNILIDKSAADRYHLVIPDIYRPFIIHGKADLQGSKDADTFQLPSKP